MVDAVAAQVAALIARQGISPSEIVILAPYLSDALRFAVTSRLEAASIPWRTLRPSRSLRDESASHVLLTLAALAHPHWNIRPSKFDVAYALMLCFDMDLVRAQMLAEIVYRPRESQLCPHSTASIVDMQERLTFALGDRYSALRDWLLGVSRKHALAAGSLPAPLLRRGALAAGLWLPSQPRCRPHRFQPDRVRSATSGWPWSRRSSISIIPDFDFGREYINMLLDGVIAAQYLESWKTEIRGCRPRRSRIFIPGDEPPGCGPVLARCRLERLVRGPRPAADPSLCAQPRMACGPSMDLRRRRARPTRIRCTRLVSGLLHRCRERLDPGHQRRWARSGFEQRGPLLKAFQRVLQCSCR